MGANEGYSPCQTRTQARSRPCSCRPCRPRPCGCHGLTHHAPKHKQIQTITNTGIRGLQQCYKHSGCVCHTIIEQIDITVPKKKKKKKNNWGKKKKKKKKKK